jgi:hypothetical protein
MLGQVWHSIRALIAPQRSHERNIAQQLDAVGDLHARKVKDTLQKLEHKL